MKDAPGGCKEVACSTCNISKGKEDRSRLKWIKHCFRKQEIEAQSHRCIQKVAHTGHKNAGKQHLQHQQEQVAVSKEQQRCIAYFV